MVSAKNTCYGLLSLVLFQIAALPARADILIVSPGAETSTEGSGNNGFPFNIAQFALSSQRYQQVYGASDFSSLGGPELITQILFRPDAQSGSAFSSTLPNVQIDLSTTAAAPDALSPTFASNVGANDTVVYSGPLSLSSAFTGPAGGPKNFDIVINLATPFLYNPLAGNLLLDVRNFGGGSTTQFDAEFLTGDPSSRAFSLSSNGVNSTTGTLDTGALVTEFRFTPAVADVPEPSSWLLLVTVVGGVAWSLKRRRTA